MSKPKSLKHLFAAGALIATTAATATLGIAGEKSTPNLGEMLTKGNSEIKYVSRDMVRPKDSLGRAFQQCVVESLEKNSPVPLRFSGTGDNYTVHAQPLTKDGMPTGAVVNVNGKKVTTAYTVGGVNEYGFIREVASYKTSPNKSSGYGYIGEYAAEASKAEKTIVWKKAQRTALKGYGCIKHDF